MVRVGLVVIAFIVLAGTAEAQTTSLVISDAVFVAAQVADLHSTYQALSSANGREGNPLMNVGDGGRIAIKAATTAGLIFVAHKMHPRHPNLAKVMLWTASSFTFTVAANNYRIAHPR